METQAEEKKNTGAGLLRRVGKLPRKSAKRDVIFNMFGSTMNAGITVILLMAVSFLVGQEEAGVFSLAYSTAQMMYTIASFEVRNFQVTDSKGKYAYRDFFTFRMITTALMLAASVTFVIWHGFDRHKVIVILLLCIYYALFAFSDVMQANLHKNNYLQLSGLSLGGEVLFGTAVFVAALAVTRSMVAALVAMIATIILWIAFFDLPFNRNFDVSRPGSSFGRQKSLFLAALPLFASSFLHQYIFNAPKYAIDRALGDVEQSVYGYLVMPAFVINLISIFAFRPRLLTLAEHWKEGRVRSFTQIVRKLYAWIALVTAVTLLGGWFLGIPILSLIYHVDLGAYRPILLILLLAGGFSACCTLALTLFTTMRKQRFCLVGYAVTLAFALGVPPLLVRRFGLMGAATAYLLEMILLFLILLCLMWYFLRKARLSPVAPGDEDEMR